MAKDKYADKASTRTHSSEKQVYTGKAPVAEAVAVDPTPGAPVVVEETQEEVAPEVKKGKAKGRENIEAYLKAAAARRKDLPVALIEKAGTAKTKNEAKRIVKEHLRAVGAP